MPEREHCWKLFYHKMDAVLRETLNKDIIIFGSNPGGELSDGFMKIFITNRLRQSLTVGI